MRVTLYEDEDGSFVGEPTLVENVFHIHYNVSKFSTSIYKRHRAALEGIKEALHTRGYMYLYSEAPYDKKVARLWKLSDGLVEVNNNRMTLVICTED